LISRLKSKTSN